MSLFQLLQTTKQFKVKILADFCEFGFADFYYSCITCSCTLQNIIFKYLYFTELRVNCFLVLRTESFPPSWTPLPPSGIPLLPSWTPGSGFLLVLLVRLEPDLDPVLDPVLVPDQSEVRTSARSSLSTLWSLNKSFQPKEIL